MSKRSRNRQTARARGPQPADGRSQRPGPAAPAVPGSQRTEVVGRRTQPAMRRRDRDRPVSRRSPILPLALGGVLVLAAAILAIGLSQSGGSPAGSGTAGSSVSTLPPASTAGGGGAGSGDVAPLPHFGSDGQDPATGQPIPEVSSTSFDGTPVSIVRDGTPKLLLFLAHWCPHCQNEVPKVQAWVDQNGLPDGVDFISIATSIDANRPNYPPDAWLARERWSVPVLVDPDNTVANLYGLSAFPFWVAVNGDGTVALRHSGAIPGGDLGSVFQQLRATGGSPSGSSAGSSPAEPPPS